MRRTATNVPIISALDVLGLLTLVVALCLLAVQPAHAQTLTVNNTVDPGDGDCEPNGGCTLREAINEANATTADTIWFDIPGSGVKTIRPASKLPAIEEAVTIDGYSQPGTSPNTLTTGTNAVLRIQLSGEDAPDDAYGLKIDRSGSVIKGLVINGFGEEGILLNSDNAKDNAVKGNFIGTDAAGTSQLPNFTGVEINNASDNSIGGSRPAARNLISGNEYAGVEIVNSVARDNAVLGNLIGTEKNATADLGNAGPGVAIVTSDASENIVGGTLPGTANTIAFNGNDGVTVYTGTGNSILRNSIFSNDGIGIDLADDGATPNDTKDPDAGPNNLQNEMNITSAGNAGGKTTVEGSLNSLPNRTFRIRFFSNPSGNEGKKYIGSKNVSTNANGNTGVFVFTPENKVPAGWNVTATVTRDSTGDTSEFSAPEVV